jgi:hypothetical protein
MNNYGRKSKAALSILLLKFQHIIPIFNDSDTRLGMGMFFQNACFCILPVSIDRKSQKLHLAFITMFNNYIDRLHGKMQLFYVEDRDDFGVLFEKAKEIDGHDIGKVSLLRSIPANAPQFQYVLFGNFLKGIA